MKLTLKKYKQIKEFEIKDLDKNILMELILLIINKNQTLLKYFFVNSFDEDMENFNQYLDFLIKNNFISNKDLDFILKSLKVKIKENENDEFSLELAIENIINHLNLITNKKFRSTDKRKSLIIKWLKKDYSVDDFFKMHKYYFLLWGDNPEFSVYLRPETLYNNKFENRVEESKIFFDKIEQNKECINNIIDFYYEKYNQYVKNENVLLLDKENKGQKEESFLKEMKFLKLAKYIIFWLSKGYNCEIIKEVIEASIESWSKKNELIPYISLEKILDEKYPQRVIALKNKIRKDKSIDALSKWLNNKK